MRSVKTVWHWKNVAKLGGLCLCTASIWSVVVAVAAIPDFWAGAGCIIVGIVTAEAAPARWDLFHYDKFIHKTGGTDGDDC